ncbi:discoidin domain-containing protein [Microtetraspora malaysiensis]|uniref:discoidin domain-containing protein n=1 Tax=Microtetraspora malaysiensis TaxID=161358 RepID=UPI003D950301
MRLLSSLLLAAGLMAGPLTVPAPAAAVAAEAVADPLKLIPSPSSWTAGSGSYSYTASTRVVAETGSPAVQQVARTLVEDLTAAGRPPAGRAPVTQPSGNAGDVSLAIDPGQSALGAEGYTISITDRVRIVGFSELGVFNGTRTLLQMLHQGATLPGGTVQDTPKYGERGVTLCSCRVKHSMAALERLIRDMAYVKLNHLTWVVYVRDETMPTTDWAWYTPEEIRQVVALADKYHVAVSPEINLLGFRAPAGFTEDQIALKDRNGKVDYERVDVSKPAVLDAYKKMIDAYAPLFGPDWHIGSDEYMLARNPDNYPQLKQAAEAKFGPGATYDDLVTDLINQMDEYAAEHGKRLRMWNDGLHATAKVKLNSRVVVEHWTTLAGTLSPQQLMDRGHQVMNSTSALYLVRGGSWMNPRWLYDNRWMPTTFAGDLKVGDQPGLSGAKVSLWPDYSAAQTEREVEDEAFGPTRYIAQLTWQATYPEPTFDAFQARVAALGRAPGWEQGRGTPYPDGTYTLGSGSTYLTYTGVGKKPSVWKLTATADNYYTISDWTGGQCLAVPYPGDVTDPRMHQQPGTKVELRPCAAGSKLQRWEFRDKQLVNAITQLIVVPSGEQAVQQTPPQRATWAVSAVGAPANLALGRPVTGDSHPGYVLANAVDGDPDTYWESSGLPGELTVDLDRPRRVAGLILRVPPSKEWAARTQNITVLTSINGKTYSTAVATQGYTFDPASGGMVRIGLSSPVLTRKVRLSFTGNTARPAGQLSEVEVYSEGFPPDAPTNLALGKAAIGQANGPYVPAKAVDGEANSYWESPAHAWPQPITVDLGGTLGVKRLVLRLPPSPAWGARTQTLSVQTSVDGTTYDTVVDSADYTFDPASGNEVTITLPTLATVRHLRLEFTGNTGWAAAQLSELEAYSS